MYLNCDPNVSSVSRRFPLITQVDRLKIECTKVYGFHKCIHCDNFHSPYHLKALCFLKLVFSEL